MKISNKKLKNITFCLMNFIIVIQSVLFCMLDISSKPEPLVNYVVTFIILCMVNLLTRYYFKTLSEDEPPNMYYYGILVSVFLYAFAITIRVSFPAGGKYIVAQMTVLIVVYLLGLMTVAAFSLYFITFYTISKKGRKMLQRGVLLICTLFALFVLTNLKTHLFFYCQPDGTLIYPRTYLIINICPIILFFFHLYETLHSDIDRAVKQALLSYWFFAIFFVIIDSLPFDSNTICIDSGIALGSLLSIYTVFYQICIQNRIELNCKKAELSEKQTQIMISQIQPHFLYNTLSAIYVLAGENPKLAQKTIKDFSKYLRQKNTNSLNYKELVSFEKELEHTKTYLTIEKLRFEYHLKVEYDIQYADFMLPPLTLQPLVENAVKYGIRKQEDGGTIQIQTCKENGKIYIRVHDDGEGFDPLAVQDDGKDHIGLETTRQRIESMCDGQLIIETSLEHGTTATIILEDKQ